MADHRSKYEVRSNEVQEVMKTPPNFVVRWGNTMIILAIVTALILLNRVQLQLKEQLPAAFIKQQPKGDSPYHAQQLIFALNIQPQQALPPHSSAKVRIMGNNAHNSAILNATMDSIWTADNTTYLALHVASKMDTLLTSNNLVIHPTSGMPVSIDILTGSENILYSMLRKLLLKQP